MAAVSIAVHFIVSLSWCRVILGVVKVDGKVSYCSVHVIAVSNSSLSVFMLLFFSTHIFTAYFIYLFSVGSSSCSVYFLIRLS